MLLHLLQQGDETPFGAFMLFNDLMDLVPIDFGWFHIRYPSVLLFDDLYSIDPIIELPISIGFQVAVIRCQR
jgi:hypothetical protein